MNTTFLWALKESERIHHKSPEDVVADLVDGLSGEQTPEDLGVLLVHQFRPMKASLDADHVLEGVLETLDEEFAYEYCTKPTDGMKRAAQAFVDAILTEYKVEMYEPTGNSVRIDAAAWAKANRPGWLAAKGDGRE